MKLHERSRKGGKKRNSDSHSLQEIEEEFPNQFGQCLEQAIATTYSIISSVKARFWQKSSKP
eukprot:c30358_g1_i1 orf=19-204(-)